MHLPSQRHAVQRRLLDMLCSVLAGCPFVLFALPRGIGFRPAVVNTGAAMQHPADVVLVRGGRGSRGGILTYRCCVRKVWTTTQGSTKPTAIGALHGTGVGIRVEATLQRGYTGF